MKAHKNKFIKAVNRELHENKVSFIVYTILRLLVIAVMVLQVLNKNYQNAFLCVLTLFLMILPSVVQATFKVELPSLFEVIVLVFIFSAEILGEINAFYIRFQHWDTVLHTLNGFLCAAIGFSLVDLINRERRMKFNLSPMFMAITAFCFSMTIGVLWEFFEFFMDLWFHTDMQKDTVVNAIYSTLLDSTKQNEVLAINNINDVIVNKNSLGVGGYLDIGLIDTMYDLFVNFIGAVVFSVMGFFYVKRRDKKGIVKNLVLMPWNEDKNNS